MGKYPRFRGVGGNGMKSREYHHFLGMKFVKNYVWNEFIFNATLLILGMINLMAQFSFHYCWDFRGNLQNLKAIRI
jgi:hypothetical protein